MAGKPIDRISIRDTERFFAEYLLKRRPAVITDLFCGEKIREASTLERAIDAFGHSMLACQPQFLGAGEGDAPRELPFREYWDIARRDPDTPLICTGQDLPPGVMKLFTLPDFCRARDLDAEEVLGMPRKHGDHDLVLHVFFANEGKRAPLHFDGDHRQVLLYQVFGTKEVILFPPESGGQLNLPTCQSACFGGVALDLMKEEDKEALLERAGGYRTVIYPGETIFIPPLMWHYLRYLDAAMSFNIRFGRHRYSRFLCIDNFHRDFYIQNFSALLTDAVTSESRYSDALQSITREYLAPGNLKRKVVRMRSLFKQLCAVHCDGFQTQDYYLPGFEAAYVDVIVRDVKHVHCYISPEVARRVRPEGPITTLQMSHVENMAAERGYDEETFGRLMQNRIGKSSLASLTRVEASILLSYMRAQAA